MSYSIASCCHIGLCRLDLALRAKIQVCIYIYILAPLCAQASISVYIHIYGLYTPNSSLAYIYMDSIYMFSAFIWLWICTISFAYTILACCKLVVLHHYGYYNYITTIPEPLPNLLLFTVLRPKLQKPMIKQPQLDANLQPNQLEPTIPNQTPAIVDLVHCYLAHLH